MKKRRKKKKKNEREKGLYKDQLPGLDTLRGRRVVGDGEAKLRTAPAHVVAGMVVHDELVVFREYLDPYNNNNY